MRIGSQQAYQVTCGVDLVGGDLSRTTASSLLDCIAQCTATTSCLGITYEAEDEHGSQNCYLKSSISIPIPKDYAVDSAIRIPDDVQDDCEGLAEELSVNNTRFHKYCGMDYPRNDDGVDHANSMEDCLRICADHSECAGVSYEPGMAHSLGYWNCYLKSATATQGLVKQTWKVDSAFAVDTDGNTETTISSSLAPTSTLAAVSSLTLSLPSAPVATSTSSTNNTGGSSPSKAWIAGAVLGPVLGVVLVALLCFLLYKRRQKTRHGHADAVQSSDRDYSDKVAVQRDVRQSPDPQELPAQSPRHELDGRHL